MKFILDDSEVREGLYPFTQIRNAADIRIGILTIREKWQHIFGVEISSPANTSSSEETKVIPANRIPLFNTSETFPSLTVQNSFAIEHPWDIARLNDLAIREDFKFITKGKTSAKISSTNTIVGDGEIFLEQGVIAEHVMLNAAAGPIYLGKNCNIMEGTMIRGPVAICEGAVVKMGTKIYGGTTIGPYCTAGGEIKNSVMFGYSNKAHDGYLGDSVIGEWCNIGAGTSNSNLKNTAGDVKVWNNKLKQFSSAGLKCGLIMGDYSRAAINTSFNTGTVCGISCNIFGAGIPPKYISDFTWGNEVYQLDKVLRDIANWKKLKGQTLATDEVQLITDIYHSAHKKQI